MTDLNNENHLLLRPERAAELLSMSKSTLAKLRCMGGGPEFVKIGKSIFYEPEALRKWIAAHTKPHTSAY